MKRLELNMDETEIGVIHSAMAYLWYWTPSSWNQPRYLATLERLLSQPRAEIRERTVGFFLGEETGDGACLKLALDTLRSEFELSPEERIRQSVCYGKEGEDYRGWPSEAAAIGGMKGQIEIVFASQSFFATETRRHRRYNTCSAPFRGVTGRRAC